MATVAVVPGGGENVNSVLFALERLGAEALLTLDPATIAAAPRVILMGVGAAPPAMAKLRRHGLVDCIRALRQPVLGICIGMQLLYERSAEGNVECLGILPGRIERLPGGDGRAIPHMGWNRLELLRPDDPLLRGIAPGVSGYFANSYHAAVSSATVATVDHGVPLSAVVAQGNFHGCQFHPEKSRRAGAALLENFLRLP